MTEAAAPAPAAPPPAAAAPASAEAPATAAAPPPQQGAQKRLQAFVTKKTYGTKPAAKAPMPAVQAAAAPAPVSALAIDTSPTESAAGSEAAPTEAKETPAPVEPKAAEKPESQLTEAEFSRRMARLTRAEERITQARREFAQERERSQQIGQKLQVIEQAAAAAKLNPLGFLQQLGISSQAVLDAIIADGAKPEATKLEESRAKEAESFRSELEGVKKELKEAVEARQREKWESDVSEYKRAVIVPMLADRAKYELTLRMLGPEGAVNEIFDLQRKRHALTLEDVRQGRRQQPETLSPEQAASIIESHLRAQRDKLAGTSANPSEKQAPPKGQEPAIAPSNGSPTHKTASPRGQFVTAKKPYSTRDKGAA